jgi:phage/plasmid-like protein (TIGR03299 family)
MSDYFESGFTVREPAWHGKGKVADRYPKDWNEAREWAGLTWDPVEVPVFTKSEAGEFVPLDGFKGVARSDTGKMLTVRTGAYQIIDHAAMGEIVEAILEQPNVKYETAGVVREGKAVWALAFLDEPVTIPGDNSITLPYLAITNTHDGTGSCRANSTSVKIVCANTFAASEVEGERNGTIFTFPHKGSWKDRVDDARQTITGLRRDFNLYVETAKELLAVRVTPEQSERFIREFIPAPPEGLVTDRVMNNVEQARAAVRTILASPTSDGIGDTAWGLVQAAGEYLDHYRAFRTMDSHYTRQLLRPEPLKTKAIGIVREVVSV